MSVADLFLGSIIGLGVTLTIIVINSIYRALRVKVVISPPWFKKIKSFVKHQPLGIVALFHSDEDTNPRLVWSYIYENKLHWKNYSIPIKRQIDNIDYSEILPGGRLRKGEPYFNTLDAHEASEGHAIRMLGTGGMTATNLILIFGLIAIGGLTLYTWYTNADTLNVMNTQLKDMGAQLNNLTRTFLG